jgi:hypothetical protein
MQNVRNIDYTALYRGQAGHHSIHCAYINLGAIRTSSSIRTVMTVNNQSLPDQLPRASSVGISWAQRAFFILVHVDFQSCALKSHNCMLICLLELPNQGSSWSLLPILNGVSKNDIFPLLKDFNICSLCTFFVCVFSHLAHILFFYLRFSFNPFAPATFFTHRKISRYFRVHGGKEGSFFPKYVQLSKGSLVIVPRSNLFPNL